jgi:sec-independent protein translocase protein TatA
LLGIGTQELLILFLVVLLLFGAERIPEVARGLGKSIRDFKKAAEDIETEIKQVSREKELLKKELKVDLKRDKEISSKAGPIPGAHGSKKTTSADTGPGETP